MANTVQSPLTLQLVNLNDDKTITLNKEAFEYVLSKDEIKDRYISIISITGVYRQGKSFLLNFFVRYLRLKCVMRRNVTDWLTPEDGPLKGFTWASGSKRHTTGIHMWREVFLTELPTGEEVAIILLDTQGAFDNQSSISDCGTIFALSTLISSVQIYNVMRNIKQYDLAHLQCFGGYGKLVSNTETAPFQNLIILVRDWPCAHEKPYGSVGGSLLLNEIFDSKDVPEVQAHIDNVKELFDNISCFLLPYPGQIVDTSPNFDGSLQDIDKEFKMYVQEFVPSIVAPENLVLKTVNGERIRAGDLVYYINEYCKVLKEGSLPEIQTVYQASKEAMYKVAVSRAVTLYKKNMDCDHKRNPRCYTALDLEHQHCLTKLKAIQYYENVRKFEDPELNDTYLHELRKSLDEAFKEYVKINDKKIKAAELEKRRRQQQVEAISRRRVDNNQRPGNSDGWLSTADPVQVAGTAVAVVGGIAALAFGVSKLFTRRNND